ncbi:MAG: hypothetical protein ACK5H1_06005 [Tenacibaculum sp.]
MLQKQGFITQYSNIKQRKSRFTLTIPRCEIQQYTGNDEPEGSSQWCQDLKQLITDTIYFLTVINFY